MYKKILVLLLTLTSVQLRYLDEDMLLYWRRSNTRTSKCVPFTTFSEQCNRCICSAEGIAYCTRMICSDTVRTPRRKGYERYLRD